MSYQTTNHSTTNNEWIHEDPVSIPERAKNFSEVYDVLTIDILFNNWLALMTDQWPTGLLYVSAWESTNIKWWIFRQETVIGHSRNSWLGRTQRVRIQGGINEGKEAAGDQERLNPWGVDQWRADERCNFKTGDISKKTADRGAINTECWRSRL